MELENERKSSLKVAVEEIANINNNSTTVADTQTPIVDISADASNIAQVTDDANDQRIAKVDTVEKIVETVELPPKSDEVSLPEEQAETPIQSDQPLSEEKNEIQLEASINDNKETAEEPEKAEEPAKIESFAAAMSSGNTADIGSRFYIKRRILVGNVSKYIAPGTDQRNCI
jgi:hypothetical protein